MTINVLFVCLGNICRSPTAHGVFAQRVSERGLQSQIQVDSAGTGDWHVGEAPDKRATAAAAKRGFDLSSLRARQVSAKDFGQYHYVIAMDNNNLADLNALKPHHYNGELALFLSYGSDNTVEVPDPYYGAGDGFEQVLDLVEQASDGLLAAIMQQHPIMQTHPELAGVPAENQ